MSNDDIIGSITQMKFEGPFYNNSDVYLRNKEVWITNPSCDGKKFVWNDRAGFKYKLIVTDDP